MVCRPAPGSRAVRAGSGMGGSTVNRADDRSQAPLKVVCVIDLQSHERLQHRKKAWEEVKLACRDSNANCSHIQFEKLDFGETNVLDSFYNADVALVDLTVQMQQSSLFYHLGVRESFGMKGNILLTLDYNTEITAPLKASCKNYGFISYRTNEQGQCCVTDYSPLTNEETFETREQLSIRLTRHLQDVEIQAKVHMKEKFLADLRKTRETVSPQDMSKALNNMRRRLDDPNILSADVVLSMLLSFREIQDYDAMVKLVDDLMTLPNHKKYTSPVAIRHLFAFALSRRKGENDRDRALKVIHEALERTENHVPDMLCLCGRIYKDIFVESGHTDSESLEKAIHWYRKGFEVQPNEYAGVNLATLLVVAGNEFSKSRELQQIGMTLNNLIGKKGSLSTLQDYWDIATFFEISVLAENYSKAIQAAESMFKLKSPNWYLKSTIGNITLIQKFRKHSEESEKIPEMEVFNFWMDYFSEGIQEEAAAITIRFPVLVLEPTKEYMPSYVVMNLDAETSSMHISNLCLDSLKGKCRRVHEWVLEATNIKSISQYKRDDRCVFLYVHQNSDDFQMFFPSATLRQRFYDLVLQMTADMEGMVHDLGNDCSLGTAPQFEYEVDEVGHRIVLGKGTYGVVYAARDLTTQVRIAVKEIPEKNLGDVQPLHEEINLHKQLRHRNIVQYLGSVSSDGFFKIFMEEVPGGSLSAMLKLKWGPLKNEATIAFYTKQILEGVKYLHDQKIVHRDIKGDNVLVNTYSGMVKISDFGTSKRLAGLCPTAETFTGTLQYMAPEVIDKGQRGYGAPADIWSVGCTVVEMATGKPPFIELGSPEAAMFKVGFYKMHPQIPESLSDKAKKFLLSCFEANPEKRATAAMLLDDPFLNESGRHGRKKNLRLTMTANMGELNRSISVPADRVNKQERALLPRLGSSPDESASYGGAKPSGSAAALVGSPASCSTLSFSSSAEFDDTVILRRNSSIGFMSPDVDSPRELEDGFYLLKKDSHRRMTLHRVLTQDQPKIVDVWYQSIRNEPGIGQIMLTTDQLSLLLQGLRDFIPEQNKTALEAAINSLREELEFDGRAMDQIHRALYLFQDAVNTALRSHNIKPHWMFALDSLVRSAIQMAILILSPELGANLLGDQESEGDADEADSAVGAGGTLHPPEPAVGAPAEPPAAAAAGAGAAAVGPAPAEEGSTSGVSTINSVRHDDYTPQTLADLHRLRSENKRLLSELLESQRDYKELLRWTLSDKTLQIQLLAGLSPVGPQQPHHRQRQDTEYSSQVSVADSGIAASPVLPPTAGGQLTAPAAGAPPHIQVSADSDGSLVDWLVQHGADHLTVSRFINEGYHLDDVLAMMTREDLRRLHLRGGMELRLWRALCEHRRRPALSRQNSTSELSGEERPAGAAPGEPQL
ncbi:mitogen-activated protein kinase kinase kinase 15-like isoform X4 [Amphibalanus amphitrite]|uniref:mitogen-activated protein kinase kinase kinase 15-like isoform X4 n=1 Tax=Amphibalanus amphitrite TaxID=1232801 RepID=UPI001C90418A|nr:mitogen-activated protein kinase kinase kinase 15-like isoform X4 [Amphibalanus amphitrite]